MSSKQGPSRIVFVAKSQSHNQIQVEGKSEKGDIQRGKMSILPVGVQDLRNHINFRSDNLNVFLMEDDLTILSNERRPQYFVQRKTTSIFLPNGRRPQYFGKWKTTSVSEQ